MALGTWEFAAAAFEFGEDAIIALVLELIELCGEQRVKFHVTSPSVLV